MELSKDKRWEKGEGEILATTREVPLNDAWARENRISTEGRKDNESKSQSIFKLVNYRQEQAFGRTSRAKHERQREYSPRENMASQ